MDLCLEDRVVFVAGSSRGIGRAIAHAFLQEGANVVVSGRQAGPLAETARTFEQTFGGDRVLSCHGDLSQSDQIAAALVRTRARWPRIDCLVANVGSGTAPSGWQIDESEWHASFEVNFWSTLRLIDAVLPSMVEAGTGNIVSIASIAGLEALKAPLPYSVAKSALVSHCKNLAREVARHGVRVNCVAPGNILFPGGSWEKRLEADRDRFERYIRTEVPLRRFGSTEEIADLVVFLASDRAAFVTGACFVADGGQTRAIG